MDANQEMTLSSSQSLQKIHPELNLEKWVIWKPSHATRGAVKTEETYEREVSLADNSTVKAQVIMRGAGMLGLLTTEDQKTYYCLVKLWEESGRPTGGVLFSLRRIAKMQQKSWGAKTINGILSSLRRLVSTTLEWNYAFYDKEQKTVLRHLHMFHILSELDMAHRSRGDKIGPGPQGVFKFNSYVLKNLQHHYTKPLYLDVILGFKTEIAQLLYSYLDLMLADKQHYTRRSEGLFKDLGLNGETYIYPSKRKEKLERPLQELQGVRLSTGILSEITLVPTRDDKDFNVVFVKTDFPQEAEPPADAAADTAELDALKACALAESLVSYFHQQLSRPKHKITPKELSQADTLLFQHGEVCTRYIVNFAIREAQKTNFAMRMFGAILQYEADALHAYRQEQQKQKRRKPQMTAPIDGAHPVDAAQNESVPASEPHLKTQFEALDPSRKQTLYQRAEQRLASHKANMTAAGYAHTLEVVVLQEFQRMKQQE